MNTIAKKHMLNPDGWINSYNDMFVYYTSSRVSHIEIAKDLVQETFLDAFVAAPNYRGDARERTWLMAILKRKIIDHYRECNTKKGRAFMLANQASGKEDYSWLQDKVANSDCEDGISQLDYKAMKDIIKSRIKSLPKLQSQVITLKISGWETNDICEELGVTQSNLWVILHRARKSLKSQLRSLMN